MAKNINEPAESGLYGAEACAQAEAQGGAVKAKDAVSAENAVNESITVNAEDKAVVTGKKTTHKRQTENCAEYCISELAAASRKRFNTPPEAVVAALTAAGKEKASIHEAEGIIKAFMQREVK